MPKGGKTFIGLTVLFALVCLTFLIRLDKGEIHLALDQWHIDSNPSFFKYFTYLGDGLAFVAVVIGAFALKRPLRVSLSFAACGLLVLTLVGVLKGMFFSEIDRPWGYFEEGALRLIDGLEQHKHRSFPSGHTTAAFALYGLLAFWINKRWASVGLFAIAVLVGYSRMYLNQHFLVDVFVGSILGTLIAWGTYVLFINFKRK